MIKRVEISVDRVDVQKDIAYIKQLEDKVNQLEKELEHYKVKEIERINKDLLQSENDYLERCIKANISGDING